MSCKIIKAQFNDSCISGLHLSLESTAIFANRNKLVCVEVGREGINVQPGPGGVLYLNTTDIKGPLHKQSSIPMDWLPNVPFLNQTSRKRFDLPVITSAVRVGICAAAFSSVLALR
jgi:hypothetical protein